MLDSAYAVTLRSVETAKSIDCPSGTHAASLGRAPAEARRLHQLRPREEIVRRRLVREALHEEMDLHVVEPAVPMPDRKRRVRAHLVLLGLALFGDALVVVVRHRAGIDDAGEEDGVA